MEDDSAVVMIDITFDENQVLKGNHNSYKDLYVLKNLKTENFT